MPAWTLNFLVSVCFLLRFLWSIVNGTPWVMQSVNTRKPYLTLNTRTDITVAGLASAAPYTSRDPLLGPIEFKTQHLQWVLAACRLSVLPGASWDSEDEMTQCPHPQHTLLSHLLLPGSQLSCFPFFSLQAIKEILERERRLFPMRLPLKEREARCGCTWHGCHADI